MTKKNAKPEVAETLKSLTGVYACTMALTPKALAVAPRSTLQRGEKPTMLGKEWHRGCKPATNSRHTTLAALGSLPQPFSYDQAIVALSALPKATLGSGTPRSYLVAFVKEGYLSAAVA